MAKASEVFKKIRFAKLDPHHDKGPKTSTDDEEHGAVSEIEWDQQLKHVKKRAMQEDLRQWFDKDHPEGGWKRINSKGEAIGPCAREPGEPKPKCMSNEKRAQLSKKERAAAVAAKRRHDPNPERKGEPINVSNYGKGKISEDVEYLEEKNAPTNPGLWARAKAMARAKFDVYPSAYANGWAAKWYKSKGGGWKSVSEEVEQIEEGRPSQRHPLEGHEYHRKTNAELEYIAKDAHKAAEAMKSHNTDAENKYRDQANDSATVRYYRQKHGMQPWYKKKYGHMNEEQKPPFDGPYKKSTGTVTDKSGAKHTPMSRARDLARDAMKKVSGQMQKKKLEESRKADIVREAMKAGKKKKETKASDDKFQSEPELSSQIIRND